MIEAFERLETLVKNIRAGHGGHDAFADVFVAAADEAEQLATVEERDARMDAVVGLAALVAE